MKWIILTLSILLMGKSHCNGLSIDCTLGKADLIIAIDTSSSMTQTIFTFDDVTTFVKELLATINIGPDNIRVGLITYSDSVDVILNLNDYRSLNQLEEVVDDLSLGGSSTNANSAMTQIERMLSNQRGDRNDVRNYVIIITDGESRDGSPIEKAREIRRMGTTIMAVGLGDGVNEGQLLAMASPPDDSHVVKITSLDRLDIKNQELKFITTTLCSARQACNNNLDLIFALDGHSSTTEQNFNKMKKFVIDVVRNFPISSTHARVGVMTYGRGTAINFYLNNYSDQEKITEEIDKIQYPGSGSRDLVDGLRRIRTEMFSNTRGNRDDAIYKNVGVFITTGLADDGDTSDQANEALQAGITLLHVDISVGNPRLTINPLAKKPFYRYMYNVTGYDALNTIVASLAGEICSAYQGCSTTAYHITPYNRNGIVSPRVGRLAVNMNGQWNSVCDDRWDNKEASIVCKCLYPGETADEWKFLAYKYHDPTINNTELAIGLDELSCTDSDVDIRGCSHVDSLSQNCNQDEAAGIDCNGNDAHIPEVPNPEIVCNSSAMEVCFNINDVIPSVIAMVKQCSSVVRIDNATHACFKVPLGKCDPFMTTDSVSKRYCYTIGQSSDQPVGSPILFEQWNVTSCCTVAKNGSVSQGYGTYIEEKIFNVSANYSFDMNCYFNNTFEGDPIQFPITILTGQDIYCKVCVESQDNSIMIVVPGCQLLGTATGPPTYPFLADKCPISSALNVVYYPMAETCWGFKFKSIKFQGFDELFVNCDTYACDRFLDSKDYCDRTCQSSGSLGRKKRDTIERFKSDDDRRLKRDVDQDGDIFTPSRFVSLEKGPLYVKDDGLGNIIKADLDGIPLQITGRELTEQERLDWFGKQNMSDKDSDGLQHNTDNQTSRSSTVIGNAVLLFGALLLILHI
ncbi:unnamed protein product [Owenia fusiformis]|uniref:Uncharacterized protein n=1 Tax=Owenia fusiformis TaxID=6347 RepID=A0A8S4Q843_OWEFU|nr:unnamed protein product [Owenia fusiformis]